MQIEKSGYNWNCSVIVKGKTPTLITPLAARIYSELGVDIVLNNCSKYIGETKEIDLVIYLTNYRTTKIRTVDNNTRFLVYLAEKDLF